MANKKTNENEYFETEVFDVQNVRELESGAILFTLTTKGLTLYDMRYIPAGKNKDGKRYKAFVACPESKGKDGKYYKRYNIYLSPEDVDTIVDIVEDAIKSK